MTSRPGGAQGSAIGAGLLSGAIAAVAASLLQLPLHAPTDTLFNSATVTAGALLAGLAVGRHVACALAIPGHGQEAAVPRDLCVGRLRRRGCCWRFMASSQLDRSASYIVPLAAIVVRGGCRTHAHCSPGRGRRRGGGSCWRAVAFAASVGAGLAGFGDQESGRLELPPRSSSLV